MSAGKPAESETS